MTYFYYTELLQPFSHIKEDEQNDTDVCNQLMLENFKESLDKTNGYYFNKLINILNKENIDYEVKEGFNFKSDNELLNNFNQITFVFKNIENIPELIKKYDLNGLFDIKTNKKNFTYKFTKK